VGVGIRLEDLVNRDRVAADDTDPVADLSGRRNHLKLAAITTRAGGATTGHEDSQDDQD
jgi:hypothetical protein